MARNPTVTAESRTALQKYLRDLLVCLIYVWAAAFPPACLSSVVYYIQMYKKRELWIPREEAQELEEDEYYIADLIGMDVVLEDGSKFGTLKDVMETGANDVYVVEDDKGEEILLPAIRECILDVDVEKNVMTIHLMKGLI